MAEKKQHGGARAGTGPKTIDGGRRYTSALRVSNIALDTFLANNPEKGALAAFLEKKLIEENLRFGDTDIPIIYSEAKLDGECCCDPKYNFRVYDWQGKVHCVHCRLPLNKN